MPGEDAVGLLGERRVEPVSSQAGLDVAEGDLLIEAGHRRRQHGRGVPLAQDDIGRSRPMASWTAGSSRAVSSTRV